MSLRPVEANEKITAFIEDNLQNKFDDSSFDFTRRSNNAESNKVIDTIESMLELENIIFLDLLKALKEDDMK